MQLIGVVSVLAIQLAAEARLDCWISRDTIVLGEYTELIIESDSPNDVEPDFGPLTRNFDLSNMASSSNITIRNNRQTSSRTWRVRLTPKRAGELEIAPIQVGNETTPRMAVLVKELPADVAEAIKKAAFYEMVVEPREQYVQGAIYITRKLYLSNRIQRVSDSSVGFEVDNAVFLPIKDEYSRREFRHDQQYDVHRIEVVMFPQKSGEIVLPPISTRASMYNPHTGRRMAISVPTEEIALNILPIPAEYPGDEPWFPATNVRLEDNLQPKSWKELELGEPLVRTVTVFAEDTYSIAIPEIEFGAPELMKNYPDTPTSQVELIDGRVYSNKINVFNVIPTASGEGAVGPVRLTWWDTENRRVQVEELPPIPFRIKGDPDTAIGNVETGATEVPPDDVGVDQGFSGSHPPVSGIFGRADTWVWIVIGVLGWIAAAVLLWLLLMSRRSDHTKKEPVSLSDIRKAYQRNDLRLLKGNIVKWISQRCDLSLVESAHLIESTEDGKRLLRDLNDAIYASQPAKNTVELNELITLLESVAQTYEDWSSEKNNDGIVGFNPALN